LLVIRLLHDQCTVSIDTSGALLHRRGYRQYTGKAPLRETLAAGLLLASGWDGLAEMPAPLLDPFCGSGTLPIEAALWATHTAPGLQRTFAFQQWPTHDQSLWDSILAEAVARQQSRLAQLDGKLVIQGSDRDSGVIEGAIANAERAGVAGLVDLACRPISAVTPPAGPGWLVTNPPYGLRVGEGQDLRNLYAQFGNVVRKQCPGWRVAMLSTDPALLRQTGLTLDASRSLVNGGVNVRLATGAIPPLSASPNHPIN
jgi:putative N6-adenine-specific DNA methylase